MTDSVFEIGEVLVFRGTDGLPFNLLKITKNVSRASIGPRSKLRGDFLVETSRDEENICYAIDPNCTGTSMAYAHVLRDSDGNEMTVCLDETVIITETTHKISVETWNSRNSWRIWGFPQTNIDTTPWRRQLRRWRRRGNLSRNRLKQKRRLPIKIGGKEEAEPAGQWHHCLSAINNIKFGELSMTSCLHTAW